MIIYAFQINIQLIKSLVSRGERRKGENKLLLVECKEDSLGINKNVNVKSKNGNQTI